MLLGFVVFEIGYAQSYIGILPVYYFNANLGGSYDPYVGVKSNPTLGFCISLFSIHYVLLGSYHKVRGVSYQLPLSAAREGFI